MGNVVLICGESGSGKSASLRNFDEKEVAIFNVSEKPMPFRKKLPTANTDSYTQIYMGLPKIETPSIVIDDATYLMVNAFMRAAKITGYQKYTDMAYDFNNLIDVCAALPAEKIVDVVGHSDQRDDGSEHFKTIGKMLDNYVTLEGKFSIVLKTVVKDGSYYFSTRNNGQDTVKTPIGMFESELIPNDLAEVDKVIREYYGLEAKSGET
jgi:hypothetical protein